jgi:hypothetical protein
MLASVLEVTHRFEQQQRSALAVSASASDGEESRRLSPRNGEKLTFALTAVILWKRLGVATRGPFPY